MANIISYIQILLTLASLVFGAAFINNEKTRGYNLDIPDDSLILPEILHEISGLTCIDSTSFACIQDENGILFIYDAIKNEIKRQYTFGADGDYEGIARVGSTIYVLRSDGTLFEISGCEAGDLKVNTYRTGIPANNNEALCHDPDNNRLLIGCKNKIGKGSRYKDKRVIYGFDLQTKTLTEAPVFIFDLQVIKQFALKNKIDLPTKTKKRGQIKEPVIRFKTSAICIHPLEKKLYLLSASDHLLFIFDMNGNIEHIEHLNPVLFNKAEGITFFENGDMLISNEGEEINPTVLRFNYKKN
jgi:hypothetical protein